MALGCSYGNGVQVKACKGIRCLLGQCRLHLAKRIQNQWLSCLRKNPAGRLGVFPDDHPPQWLQQTAYRFMQQIECSQCYSNSLLLRITALSRALVTQLVNTVMERHAICLQQLGLAWSPSL